VKNTRTWVASIARSRDEYLRMNELICHVEDNILVDSHEAMRPWVERSADLIAADVQSRPWPEGYPLPRKATCQGGRKTTK
jgi:hypothetical protein